MQLIGEFFSVMTVIKMGVVIVFTVSLSLVAEVVSPRFAGILSGYPMGAAVALFFMGVEAGPRFAAQSALHTSTGVVATLVFTYGYYQGSVLSRKLGGPPQILCASIAGVAGYLAASCLLCFAPGNITLGLVLPVIAILVFIQLFKGVENVNIDQRVSVRPKMLILRSLFAASTVWLVIFTAKMVGPTWAGLFSAFPHIILPLVVIIHFTYDPEHAYAILKNAPKGIGAVVIISLAVSLSYPVYGVYAGTVLAYAMATVYLVAAQFYDSLLKRS